jgi:hypothetical protein
LGTDSLATRSIAAEWVCNVAQDIDPDLARAMRVAMGGIGGPPRRDPVAAPQPQTQQAEQQAAAEQAAEQAAVAEQAAAAEQAAQDKQGIVEAIGTVRDAVGSVRSGLTEIGTQAPTEEELREAVNTTRAEIAAGTDATAEQSTQRLRETVSDWGERMEQAAEAIKPLEDQLRTAQTTLSDAAGKTNEALRPQFDRLQTALKSREDDIAGLRATFEKMTSEAKSVADPESTVPEPFRMIGEPQRDRSTEDRTADLARHLHDDMIGGSPNAEIDQLKFGFGMTETAIGDFSTQVGESDPAAVLPATQATQTRATPVAEGAAHRGTRTSSRGASGPAL